MRTYVSVVFRRFLATTVILSLLWPDLAKCMEDENDLFTVHHTIYQENMLPQEEQNFSSPVNQKKEEEEDSKKEKVDELSITEKDDFNQDLSPLSQKYLKGIFKITAQDLVYRYRDEELLDHGSKETTSLLNTQEDSDQKIINKPNIERTIKAWNNLVNVEGTWRNHFTWVNLESLPYKFLFTLFTNEYAVNKNKLKKHCSPLWLYGRAIPLQDNKKKSAMTRNVAFRTLGSTLAETVLEIISTTLIATLGYQFYEVIHSRTIAASWSSIADFFSNANSVSFLGIINKLHKYPGLFSIIGIPIGLGLVKAVWKAFEISRHSNDSVKEARESLEENSDKFGNVLNALSVLPVFSSFLDFHPIKRDISRLAHLLLWNVRLSSENREEAFEAILKVAQDHKGLSQMAAIEALAHLAHGWNIRNLELVPSKIKELLKIKIEAFLKLNDLYKKLPCYSLNKFRTGILLWEIGQCSPIGFIVRYAAKIIKLSLYGYIFYTLIDVLHKYATCSKKYLENFSWLGGLTPYANDYSKECFDAQVKVFNILPGQSASTLVGNLTKYYFSEPYDLDLSNKGLDGSTIADIVEGFQYANVSLNALNISYNAIANSTNMERILTALPSAIKILDMTEALPFLDPNSFLGLSRLTGLQSLNLSSSPYVPIYDNVMGQVLQNLSLLQELRLVWLKTNLTQVVQALKPSLQLLDLSNCVFNREDQIALGRALAQNLTLHQLYLESTHIGQYADGNIELANGLRAQKNLRVLNLGWNLAPYLNVNTSTLLGSLPDSVTDLYIPYNGINETSAINALAQALQQMSMLTSFDAQGNVLGNFPDFLKSLYEKQNLTYLNLFSNSLNDTAQMTEFLLNIPRSLKKLDLSGNQLTNESMLAFGLPTLENLTDLELSNNRLTNGSILAPALAKLRNLKSLKLVHNSFTTGGRLAIWNATSSFLLQSPFYLDEDLNYTNAYLRSLPPTTIGLDFSGLILNDPTAFETIMPIAVSCFTNLKQLDLSHNIIVGRNPITNEPRTKGINALIHYLPQLKYLQSLKISDSYGFVSQETAPYYQNFSQIIGQLQGLYSLDLSRTRFLYAEFLGQGLKKSHSLTSINFRDCWLLDKNNWQGGTQLIQGLQAHLNLVELDLSYSSIGYPDPNSTYALANAFQSWPHLQYLDLAYNDIGREDSDSSTYFLEKLADLANIVNKEGKILQVNLLNGIYNITWTQGAEVLRALTENTIIDACARQLCTGKAINTTQSKRKNHGFSKEKLIDSMKEIDDFQEEKLLQPVTSSASTLTPFYQPVINAIKPWFSVKAWGGFFDRALDSVVNRIVHYSQKVVENAPSYFLGTLDKNNQISEDQNKQFYNYPTPHFRTIDQGEPLDVQRFNHMQGLNYTQRLNHTFSPPMLTEGHLLLMLSK